MDRLDVWRFALAAAITFAALSGMCAVAFVISPDATIALFNGWAHGLELRLLLPPGGKAMTVGSVVIGVVSAAAKAEITGNSSSSLSERSTAALAFTRVQLREIRSNMALLP